MSKIKEKIKQILPDMKRGIERFPLTIFCGIIVFLLSFYMLETSGTNNNRFIEEVLKLIFLMILCIPLTAALELIEKNIFQARING